MSYFFLLSVFGFNYIQAMPPIKVIKAPSNETKMTVSKRESYWPVSVEMVTNISTRIYENWVSKHFVISLNFLWLYMFTLLFAYFVFWEFF